MHFFLEKMRNIKAQLLPDSIYLKMIFKKHLGYELNLKTPKTLNEKLQWLKLHYKSDMLTMCADKLAVREYISKELGDNYLIPLVYHTTRPDDLEKLQFPDFPFIIKANHNSGGIKIYRDKKDVNLPQLISECKLWLNNSHYQKTKEWQYKNIQPTILVEKLLLDSSGNIPNDIKFSCFNGKVEMIHIDSNKEIEHLRNNYTKDLKPLYIDWPSGYGRNEYIDVFPQFSEVKSLAEKLAKPFPFVRVDFYVVDGVIYFGELTFHPTSGFGRFSPRYYDFKMGSKLDIDMLRVNQ